MEYNGIRGREAEALATGNFFNERRSSPQKNLLAAGLLEVPEAIQLVQNTRGQQARHSPHHFDPTITVWVFRPTGWYIKFYLSGSCWFISFHREGE